MLALAVASRLYTLEGTVTADEGYWMQRSVRFGAALARGDLASTARTGHPGVPLLWLGTLGIGPERLAPFLPSRFIDTTVLELASGYLEAFAGARLAIVLATSALTVLVVWLATRLLGPGGGLAGGSLLLLDPYYIGMTRILHVDALLTPLMGVAALAALVYWLGRGGWGFLVIAGLAAGLAMLTKAPAALVFVFVGLLWLWAGRPARGGRRWQPALGWGLLAVLTYVVVWPAMWVDPLRRLQDVLDFAIMVGGKPHHFYPNFFLGQTMVADPGPAFYPLALAFRLGPLALFGLAALPLALGGRPKQRPALLWLGGYALLFVLLLTASPKKLDRYALPAILALDLVAGAVLWELAREIRRLRLGTLLLGGLLMAQAVICWRGYPYPLAAYNPLLGGEEAAQQLMLVGWGEGLDQVAGFLNERPDLPSARVSLHYDHVLRPLLVGTTVRAIEPVPIDYFVLYVNMRQRESVLSPAQQQIVGQEPIFVARIHGVPVAWVYQAIPPILQQRPGAPKPSDDDESP